MFLPTLTVNSNSSLFLFFLFGLLAGFSTCFALTGSLVLAFSKNWGRSFYPSVLFNLGRVVSFAVLGIILGFIGKAVSISPVILAAFTVFVSLIILFIGLQMLGVKALRFIAAPLPKAFAKKVINYSEKPGKLAPFLVGAGTFLLPCGFTLTVLSIALLSGNPVKSGLMLLFFVLGTAPALLLLGFTQARLVKNEKFSPVFLKVSGVLIILLSVFNINSEFNVLGFKNLNDVFAKKSESVENSPTQLGNVQIIKMTASSSGYFPNFFKVKAGVPVRMEINDIGTSGCTNAVVSGGLFSGQINLTPGETSIKEFTPQKAGKYKFSCWMGMVSGIIEVIPQ